MNFSKWGLVTATGKEVNWLGRSANQMDDQNLRQILTLWHQNSKLCIFDLAWYYTSFGGRGIGDKQ